MIITYAFLAIIATILFVGYFTLARKKEPWLLLLYICVTVVNVGYFLLSISKTLAFAILANDVVYLGSVFLSMSMLLTITHLCGFEIKKKLVATLGALALLMFLIIATVGFLPWYYKEVELSFVDGAAKLKKVYGVLHPLYLIYLVGYFSAMIVCIVRSIRKGMMASQKHAALLAAIVLGNIAVWFVEKFIPWNFEFLSVSYLFSETILLVLYWMMDDYVRVDLIPQMAPQAPPPPEPAPAPVPVDIATMPMDEKILRVLAAMRPGDMLTSREREILELVLMNKKRKEIADELCLSENTIKTYTRTLYGKLGISSREDLFALLIKQS